MPRRSSANVLPGFSAEGDFRLVVVCALWSFIGFLDFQGRRKV